MAEEEGKIKIKYVVDDTQLQQAVNKAMGSFKQMSRTAETEGNKVKDMFATMAKAAGGFFSVAAAMGFAKQIVAVRKEVESLEISFGTLLGSEQKAASLMRELSQFAAKTPLQLNDLARGAQMLLSFNVEAERVMPILHAIGDISMGDAGKLQSLTLAFSQMSSTGRLMGQDLLQMINAGFNPLTVIAEKTGKSVAQLKDEMSKGAISAKQVEEAFIAVTSAGGKFYGMLEKQSKGLGGSLSNLEGAIRDMMNEIGTAAQAPLVNVVQKLTELVQNYKEVGKVVGQIVIVYGTYRAALLVHAAAQKLVAEGAKKMTAAELAHYGALKLIDGFKNMKLANPYALAAAAVAALVIHVTKYVKLMNTAERLQKDMNAANDKAAASLALETKRVDDLFTALNKAKKGTDEYHKAIKDIQGQYGGYLENLKIEAETLKDSADQQERLKKAILDTARARISAGLQEEAGNALLDSTKEIRKNIDKWVDRLDIGLSKEAKKEFANKIKEAAGKGNMEWVDRLLGQLKQINEQNSTRLFKEEKRSLDVITTTGQQNNSRLEEIKKLTDEYAASLKVYEDEMETIKNTYGSVTGTQEEGKGGGSGGGNANALTEEEEKKYKSLLEAIKKGEEEIAEARLEMRRQVEQERIDVMRDGSAKTIAQINHNYDVEIDAIKKKESELLNKLNEQRKNEWAQAGGKGTFEPLKELEGDDKELIENLKRLAGELRDNQLEEATRQVFSSYMTYKDKMDAAYKQFVNATKDIDKTDPHYAEAKRQYEEAVKGINREFASRSKDFEAWAAYVSNIALDKLKVLLEQAEAELEDVDYTDTDKVAQLNAQIELLKERIASLTAQKNAKNSVDKALGIDQNTINRLQIASNVLGNMGGEVKGLIGDFVEMDENMKQLVDTIIDMGVELAKSGIDEAAKLKDATADIGDEVDNIAKSADWITMIIKAALLIVRGIVDSIKESHQFAIKSELEALDKKVKDLQDRIDNLDFSHAFDAHLSEYDDIMQQIVKHYKDLKEWNSEFDEYTPQSTIDHYNRTANNYQKADLQAISGLISKIATDYKDMEGSINKYSETLKLYTEQVYNLKQAEEAAREEAERLENLGKDKQAEEYTKQADEYAEQTKETMQNAVEYIRQYIEEVFGGSAMSLAEKFGDALIDAFKSGADAAVAFGDTVNDVMRNMVRQLVYQKVILPYIEEMMSKYVDELEKARNRAFRSGDKFNATDWWLEQLDRIMGDYIAMGEQLQQDLGNLDPKKLDYLYGKESTSASSRGIAQASQDSIDELNGRMTMIQEHTAMLSGNMVTLVGNTNGILLSVKNIDNNVENLTGEVTSMRRTLESVETRVNSIDWNGVKAL